MATKQIGTYQVQYAANSFVPRIWLKDPAGASIGQLVFLPDGKVLPSDNETNLYFHLSNYPHVMDLLRNEKPIYWSYVGSGPGNENAIRTAIEPVGEFEPVSA
jgi:hypothetical protein